MKQVVLLVVVLLLCSVSVFGLTYPEPPQPPPDPELPPPTTPAPGLLQQQAYSASLNLSESRVLRLVNRIGRTYRFMNIATLTTAGPSVENLTLLGDFSYAFIDDDAIGDDNGREYSASLYLTATIAGDWQAGLGLSRSYYHVEGDDIEIEQTMYSIDAFLLYSFTKELSAGGFIQYSDIDIENFWVVDGNSPSGFTNIGDRFNRYAVGLLASYRKDLEIVTVGVTTSVSSFNKKNLDDVFTNNDSAWITVVDVERKITDNLSVDVWASYFTLLDNQPVNGVKTDGSYWTVGLDFAYQLTDKWFVSTGYETQLSYDDYSEHRINAAVSYTW